MNIRSGCFETNSSSSHSITISTGSAHDRVNTLMSFKSKLPVLDVWYDKQGNEHKNCLVLTGGEFGWEIESHTDALTKVNYIATDLRECEKDHPKVQLLEYVLKKYTGATEIVWNVSGYIDHQSSGTSDVALVDEETLFDFIFNPNSVLHTDNDNH